ncbi:hypothetical protein ACFQ3J_03380 [Paenibacillus provencensis]|uniref:F0F1-type ATP synthase n=1 Tax=Paenibacillus provencensis TaxID=441151 RepID=A0ABW3PR34_9BACL|nr:hypothetical protein [Paenibacillus sp. MER 78]MCM3126696.1 hypothetical protein [Paenibacillus sp. MER 78]
MRITDYAILFVLIFFPVFWFYSLGIKEETDAVRLEQQYTQAVQTAVQDASSVMNLNEDPLLETSYASSKFTRVDKDLLLDTFIHTISINFGLDEDLSAQRAFLTYLPALLVIDYDGYYIYQSAPYTNQEGQNAEEHLWTEKKMYIYADELGNTVRFTLDDYVYAYEHRTGQWVEGYLDEIRALISIPLLQDAEAFDQVRRQTIVSEIQDGIAHAIHIHNEKALHNGYAYQFTLPVIPQEEWYNTIDDVGVMAFIQGIPVGTGYYNNYAFSGGRLVKTTPIVGGIDAETGIKYYYPSTCNLAFVPMERFTTSKEAAAAGYFEHGCINNAYR